MEVRLLGRALLPLGFIAAVPVLAVLRSVVRHRLGASGPVRPLLDELSGSASLGRVIQRGLIAGSPASLILAFCFTPSVCANIFQAWHCVSFYYHGDEKHSFLASDLAIRCDGSQEHLRVTSLAWALIVVWPIGMLVMYGALLWPCAKTLVNEGPATPLIRGLGGLDLGTSG